MGSTQSIGRAAEERAETHLVHHGLRTVMRNYRCRGGEIDLVMRDGEHIAFVEVRYRSNTDFGSALDSVDARKRARLTLAARHYLATQDWQGPCRFDVVGFGRDQTPQWVRDAFSV